MPKKKSTLKAFRKQRVNANKHTAQGLELLRGSMTQNGWIGAITAAADGEVFDGSARLETAGGALALDPIVVETDGTRAVIVKRTDIKTAGSKKAQRLALEANRIAQLDLSWDAEVLAQLDQEIKDGLFTTKDLKALQVAFAAQPKDADPKTDQAKKLQIKWGTKRGDLWQVGGHRLACGDCTDPRTVERLLDGESPETIITDPPFSSGGFQDGTKKHSTSIGTRQGASIARDNLTSRGYFGLISRMLGNVDIESCYMFTDWRMWSWTYDVLESSGYPVRNMLVWNKEVMGMGFPWRSQHELIAFCKRSASEMMDGKRGNVLGERRTGNKHHPTEKPVDLIQQFLENDPAILVYDPFAGSGTTLLACENLRCKGFALDLSPAYVAVTLQRMQDAFPNLTIKKIK